MKDCIFCKIVNGEIPSKKIYEDDKVMVIMDVNPQVDGHSLVIPKEHVSDYIEASDEVLTSVFKVAKRIAPKIMDKVGATGLTCGINYGETQSVKHLHLHILPDFLIKEKSRDVEEIYNLLKDID